jgi:EpsI family protein
VAAAAPYLQAANAERAAQAPPRAGLPVLAASWRGPEPDAAAWRRAAPAGAREAGGRYVGPRATADVAILRFGHGPADAEMVGSMAGLVEAARVLDTGRATAKLDGEQSVNEIMLRADRGFRVVWSWYEIDGTLVAEDWRAKLREALGVVLRGRVDAALVVASVEAPDPELARELLRDFLAEAWPEIARCVDAAAAECVEGRR